MNSTFAQDAGSSRLIPRAALRSRVHGLHPRQAGFGLLEVILVFVVILTAGVILFSVYESTARRSRITTTLDQAHAMFADVKGLMMSNPIQFKSASLASDTTPTLVPAGLQINPWGDKNIITFTGGAGFITVVVYGVAEEDCVPFIVAAQHDSSIVSIRMGAGAAIFPITPLTTIQSKCSATPGTPKTVRLNQLL